MKVLLLTPPLTQLNTPYPATAYLTGFLRERGYDVVQADPGLELALKIFSRSGLEAIGRELQKPIPFFTDRLEEYCAVIDPVIRFLQGKDPTLAQRIAGRGFLPEGPRFQSVQDLEYEFGALTLHDRAKYLASLMIDDLADVVRLGIDSRFELSRYGEKLAASEPSFVPLERALKMARLKPTCLDGWLSEITAGLYVLHAPQVVGMSAPFPGNIYGAFSMARKFKSLNPEIKCLLGGGYVNTELRQLKDPRVFQYFDFITLDDGERPILNILESLQDKRSRAQLLRTYVCNDGKVEFVSNSPDHDIPHRATGTPTYDGLPLKDYIQLFEMLNPMHRLWSDGRWNKITVAHGCYWKKCSFCDISLDYINRYDPASADILVDRIEALVQETGESGFHFTDEAAPPALLKALATRLIERNVVISWWGNIRFEKSFTPELTTLLARSGCIAVSGGLEVASDRLLKLMQKGVSVEQVSKVTRSFVEAGILVHAYLMYGFPTQTREETIEALENVRQLFINGCIHSGFWHRFSVTAHSPIGKNPDAYGITLNPEPEVTFARNDLAFTDPTGVDHDGLGVALNRALYNFMLGQGLEWDVRQWFQNANGSGAHQASEI